MRIIFALLCLGSSLIAGCRLAPDVPACTTIMVDSGSEKDKVFSGQGVWIGDRFLTVAHIFVEDKEETKFPPKSVTINRSHMLVLDARSGNLGVTKNIFTYHQISEPTDRLEDWVVLTLAIKSSVDEVRGHGLVLGSGEVKPGEKLYLLGYNPNVDGGPLMEHPLEVINVKSDKPIPLGLIYTLSEDDTGLFGWSGGAVVRKNCSKIEFVGLLSSCSKVRGESGYRIHAVVRPPEEILQELFHE